MYGAAVQQAIVDRVIAVSEIGDGGKLFPLRRENGIVLHIVQFICRIKRRPVVPADEIGVFLCGSVRQANYAVCAVTRSGQKIFAHEKILLKIRRRPRHFLLIIL